MAGNIGADDLEVVTEADKASGRPATVRGSRAYLGVNFNGSALVMVTELDAALRTNAGKLAADYSTVQRNGCLRERDLSDRQRADEGKPPLTHARACE